MAYGCYLVLLIVVFCGLIAGLLLVGFGDCLLAALLGYLTWCIAVIATGGGLGLCFGFGLILLWVLVCYGLFVLCCLFGILGLILVVAYWLL